MKSLAEQVDGLSGRAAEYARTVFDQHAAGELTAEQAAAMIAVLVGLTNAQVSQLSLGALAAAVIAAGHTPLASTETPSHYTDSDRLDTAAATALGIGSWAVTRLVRSEALQTMQDTLHDGMLDEPAVVGWIRKLEPGACDLCKGWRTSRPLPTGEAMFRHVGCSCHQTPVF